MYYLSCVLYSYIYGFVKIFSVEKGLQKDKVKESDLVHGWVNRVYNYVIQIFWLVLPT